MASTLSKYLPYATESGTPCDTEVNHACYYGSKSQTQAGFTKFNNNMDLIYLCDDVCFVDV